MAGSITKLIERMKYWCLDVSLGYDQSNREDFRNGGETDCSALVIHALKEAGFATGAASYTGNMRQALTANGWAVVPNNGQPFAGDILLNDSSHVAVYIGGGQLAQSAIDERGKSSGGQGGDQTGHETNIRSYYNYPWTCYLRYGGTATQPTGSQNGVLTVDGYLGTNTIKALQKVLGTSQDGVISSPSQMVRELQRFLNRSGAKLTVDGYLGQLTIKALQKYLGTTQDGVISKPSQMVRVLQTRLNTGRL